MRVGETLSLRHIAGPRAHGEGENYGVIWKARY